MEHNSNDILKIITHQNVGTMTSQKTFWRTTLYKMTSCEPMLIQNDIQQNNAQQKDILKNHTHQNDIQQNNAHSKWHPKEWYTAE
jgi:hypothetical protein